VSLSPARLGRCRAALFAPAVRPDFLAKLPDCGADLVIIDCEDATATSAKADGRAAAAATVPYLLAAGCQVTVRVNDPSTQWFAEDVAEGLAPGLAAVIVPKVETVESLDAVAAALDAAGHANLGVLAGLETALGVADARLLLAHPRVVGGYFGAEDFTADMGGVRTKSNIELSYVRPAVALAARLAGVPVLDTIVSDFGDDERLRSEAAEARAMGYAGKMCIHPRQVEIVNNVFTSSDEEVARARRLIAAYDAAVASGVAAINFEGQMVDEPLVVQARQVVESA